MKRTLGVLALFMSSHIYASDWEPISFGADVVTYVDKESIRFQKGSVKAWTKWMHMSPQKVEMSYPEKTFTLTKQLSLYKCSDRTYAIIQVIRYEEPSGNNVVDSYQIDEKQANYSEVVPDTLGEEMLNWVCNRKPKNK